MNATAPRDHMIVANGLRHHVLEWGSGDRVVVLLHGFLDLAFAFDELGRRLAARGYRVLAADARGHGETDWVGAGGYYYFADYTIDLDGWTRALGLERFHLVGHSMGGTVATMYAGARPERVDRLVTIEGIGPPEQPVDAAPARFGRWMDGVARMRGRAPRPMASLDDAFGRMRDMHPRLPESIGRAIAARATKPSDDGAGLVWRYDPLHRTESPVPYNFALHRAFLERIEAPTLVVLGERGMRLEDEGSRIARIRNVRTVELPGIGHMIHWEAPDALADHIATHFERDDCGSSGVSAELGR